MDGGIDGGMEGWTDVGMDGWMDGHKDVRDQGISHQGRINNSICCEWVGRGSKAS